MKIQPKITPSEPAANHLPKGFDIKVSYADFGEVRNRIQIKLEQGCQCGSHAIAHTTVLWIVINNPLENRFQLRHSLVIAGAS